MDFSASRNLVQVNLFKGGRRPHPRRPVAPQHIVETHIIGNPFIRIALSKDLVVARCSREVHLDPCPIIITLEIEAELSPLTHFIRNISTVGFGVDKRFEPTSWQHLTCPSSSSTQVRRIPFLCSERVTLQKPLEFFERELVLAVTREAASNLNVANPRVLNPALRD
jgi:hypothetical protein